MPPKNYFGRYAQDHCTMRIARHSAVSAYKCHKLQLSSQPFLWLLLLSGLLRHSQLRLKLAKSIFEPAEINTLAPLPPPALYGIDPHQIVAGFSIVKNGFSNLYFSSQSKVQPSSRPHSAGTLSQQRLSAPISSRSTILHLLDATYQKLNTHKIAKIALQNTVNTYSLPYRI